MESATNGHHADLTSAIRGVVRHADGHGVSAPVVTVIDQHGHQIGRTTGDGDGRFTVTVSGAHPRPLVVIATADGHDPTAVSAASPGVTDTEIVLSAIARLRGIVTEADGTRPVVGATVAVADSRGDVTTARRTGVDGAFEFRGLTAATYTLVVTATGHDPSAQSITVSDTAVADIAVDLRATADLTGTVVDGIDAHPVSHSQIVLLDATGETVATTATDTDGHYRFGGVGAGEHTVIANGYAPAATTVDIAGGRVLTHDFVLGAPAT
ncbi:carboxypeptidase-like regulatory domain-containing protein [Williamsia sterculiae]|uniref:Carboxypeptidase regulatory-like domain-containing protein n=1 Tax=Williamsia sterculiae TaxID=1344003 RepID=A0A1N7DFG8_9NOCA|nr:carboxypeptidase regulatory-like domain-containing protein [Williamsia sterculiae]SIR74566.1 Carboxypeptidase regulatory-like domain-containing protein [Williamsia sterculiae]